MGWLGVAISEIEGCSLGDSTFRFEHEGLERGQYVGRIRLLQELSGISVPQKDELAAMDIETLARLEAQLQVQLRGG